jgi:hypothetical protein
LLQLVLALILMLALVLVLALYVKLILLSESALSLKLRSKSFCRVWTSTWTFRTSFLALLEGPQTQNLSAKTMAIGHNVIQISLTHPTNRAFLG